jgi:hypothetical protein
MPPPTLMNLKVLLPFRIFAEKTGVSRIVAETQEGSFGLLAASARLRGRACARHSDLRKRSRGRGLRGRG